MAYAGSIEVTPIRRGARPSIQLVDAKRTILGITPEITACPESYITAIVNRYILSGNGGNVSIISQVRLQALCMVGNTNALRLFLQEFSQNHGVLATELLVNGHIRSGTGVPNCSSFYVTPLLCALLWNGDREIIRLLHSYGAWACADLDSLFPEEKVLLTPYFDHLAGGVWGPYQQPMWRQSGDFAAPVQEIRCLSGEGGIDAGWVAPPMFAI